jgi:1,4-dihydroxy-6-naphthoate synthase
MFYGLASGKVKIDGIRIEHVMEDIQSLNERALRAELEVTAISAHAFAYVSDRYRIMRTGASMGEGYGPIIVANPVRSKNILSPKNHQRDYLMGLRGKVVATPGKLTTANLLFKIYTEGIANVDMPFDQIIDAVISGKVDAGLLIHEGQITYQQMGLQKVADFGEIWAKDSGSNVLPRWIMPFKMVGPPRQVYPTGLPLPLGLDVVRKDLGEDLARRLSRALQESIRYGYQHQDEAIPYALQFGRGIDANLGARFVKMYVNELTIDMGERGQQALELLFDRAFEKKLIPVRPAVELY